MTSERARKLSPLALIAAVLLVGWAAGLGEALDTERLRAQVVPVGLATGAVGWLAP